MVGTYPNSLRTKEQRKARYCFLRHYGLNRDLSRKIEGYRDSQIVLFLQTNQNLRECECIDHRKDKRET